MEPNWLEWARKLNALAQTGLTFAENPYDIERYTTIRTIAAEMIAHGSGGDTSRVLDLFACDAGYATPKVDVRGVVFQDGKILLAQLPQYRAGNRLKIRVPSIFQSLFGWLLSQVFTGRMISVGTPSASYSTLWSGSGVALRRIRRTPSWSVGKTIVAIS